MLVLLLVFKIAVIHTVPYFAVGLLQPRGSSYPAYINKTESPEWLKRDLIYGMLGSKQQYAGYAKYVAQGNSEELIRFYSRGNIVSVIGEKELVEWLKEDKIPEAKQNEWVKKTIPHGLSLEQITLGTAIYYKMSIE